MRVLVISSVFPSVARPTYGVFVKERVRAVAQLPGMELRVIAPTPYVPPVSLLRERYIWWKFPKVETVEGLAVVRPRYLLPPKIGGYLHSELMYPSVAAAADQLWRSGGFDIIDAHFVYPNGIVASRLGRRYGVPVVVTGRGEDMHSFPELPIVGGRIRAALKRGTWCVALSNEIAEKFVRQGADPNRVIVIPNGVDAQAFYPIPQEEARVRLNLPQDQKIILSVGNLQELKGFHLLADAMPKILEQVPTALAVIIGGAAPAGVDFTREIQSRIADHGLQERVRLVGRKSHGELADWYSAADVFTLLSSREGSPNVLLEALACGTPAVTTAVGGMREELSDSRLGSLLPERTVDAIASHVTDALTRTWDREFIRQRMLERSWERVAGAVQNVFSQALETHQSAR